MSKRTAVVAADWLAKRARLSPHRVALIEAATGDRITYAAWNRRANRVAHLLRTLGLQRGDRVAVFAMNCLEYVDLLFACQKTGIILQALNWRLAVPELARLLEGSPPQALVYGPAFGDAVRELDQYVGGEVVALDVPAAAGHQRWADLLADVPDTAPDPVDLTFDDPWVLCYTGGTTGTPKAAILTHGTITWNAVNTVTSWGLTADDVAVLNAPLFHTGGLNVFTTPLVHAGGCSILCGGFGVDQLFDLLEEGRITLLFGVPAMFIMMQQHERWAAADFSKCKLVISGGAPCPEPVFEAFFEKGVAFKTGYGLTEAGPNNFWLPDEDVRDRIGSAGFPLLHVDIRIVDDEGTECPPGVVGELLIRGPHVTPGYWNNPTATAGVLMDGWLHTGDLARRDEDGYVTIVGRSKDVIISGGENIYPAEVESVLLGHPAVADVALIGVPHQTWGEVGRAIIVPAPGTVPNASELLTYVHQRLAGYKVPKAMLFVEELPTTGAGKVDRQALQRRYGYPSR